MREFTFSDEDRKAIDDDRYRHPHPHVQRKMEVLWLKSHGLPHQQIANLAGVSLRTVQRYLDEFQEGGLEGVFGVVVAQQPAAHAPHHRPVTLDEGSKGGFVAAFDEASQQLCVA